MQKQALIPLLFASIILTGCSKLEPASEFVIDGIHDVEIGVAGNILNLTVSQTQGNSLPVAITVTDLPSGITTSKPSVNTIPGHSASIGFYPTGAAPGTYPVHIVAASSEYSRTYSCNLIVTSFDGFRFGGIEYNNDSTEIEYMISRFTVYAGSNPSDFMMAEWRHPLPIADGTYTIPISKLSSDMQVYVQTSYPGGRYVYRNDASKNEAILKILHGKATLFIGDLLLVSDANTSDTKHLHVSTRFK